MKPSLALVALSMAACAPTTSPPAVPETTAPTVSDSCAAARPDFGGPATAADRDLFAYDASAPLDLQMALESVNDGVEVSAITFRSPRGGPVTGLLFDPVTRSSLRPGIVLMHGMPGTARG